MIWMDNPIQPKTRARRRNELDQQTGNNTDRKPEKLTNVVTSVRGRIPVPVT